MSKVYNLTFSPREDKIVVFANIEGKVRPEVLRRIEDVPVTRKITILNEGQPEERELTEVEKREVEYHEPMLFTAEFSRSDFGELDEAARYSKCEEAILNHGKEVS